VTAFHFDPARADRVTQFFATHLRHVNGKWAGKQFDLLDWQADEIIRPLFGTLREDGARRYRTAYLEVPRKNGKSTLAAGMALYLLFADREPGAEVYSAAADREQARIVFSVAKEMVEGSPALRKRARVKRDSIEVRGSVYRVLSAEAYTKHGLNAHGIIFDELHAQPNRELWDVLTTSTGAREQPITCAITTAGYDRSTICYEQHEYSRKVDAGTVDDTSHFSYIATAPEGADWRDPATHAAANPGYDVTVKAEYLQREAEKAAAVPAYLNTFLRLHLNIWTGQNTRWLDMTHWDRCDLAPINERELAGRSCFGGLDLASTTDIAALALLFPNDDEPAGFDLVTRMWLPEDGLHERGLRDGVPYDAWAAQGLLTTTPGNVIDYGAIRAELFNLGRRYRIEQLGYDRWGATQLAQELAADGLDMVPVGQGMATMSPALKELMHLIMTQRLNHGGNPLLRWMADNVAVQQDAAGNIKPHKAKSTGRIDGVVALAMAVHRVIDGLAGAGSVYDARGLEVI
jgi:phage terminase large subunit-like protein